MIPRVLAACAALLLSVPALPAQSIFKSDVPLEVTLSANFRDLTRERDSTKLQWFGAEMTYKDDEGNTQTVAVELRARGHFRRQAANCSFPPMFVRVRGRENREGTLLQGNPRLKLVTPCRPNLAEYQQYIYSEYLTNRTYAIIDPIHSRTRLASITYVDSTGRSKPVTVTAFFLETQEEVADQAKLTYKERTGVTWEYIPSDVIDRISLFQYWIANTDWSTAGLHNIFMLEISDLEYRPVAYDFDWSGLVNTRYSRPNATLGLTSTRQRLHRGPCRTAEQWAPTIAYFQSKRAAVDSLWTTPLEGMDPRRQADGKKYLDQLWPIVEDPRRFKREIIDQCQREGN